MNASIFNKIRKSRSGDSVQQQKPVSDMKKIEKTTEKKRSVFRKSSSDASSKEKKVMKKKISSERQQQLHAILRFPRITEKTTTQASDKNVYVFDVLPRATKKEIREAVEHLYSVSVDHVRVLRSKPVHKRFGSVYGQTSGAKKAMVKVKAGDHIDLFEQSV